MTQPLNTFLRADQTLRQLAARAQQIDALQAQFEQIIPTSLKRFTHVMSLEQGKLSLAAHNGAVAAKLKQMLPELIRSLQSQGCAVHEIRVRVQVNIPPSPARLTPPHISAAGKKTLGTLADELAESPLKAALQRLMHKAR